MKKFTWQDSISKEDLICLIEEIADIKVEETEKNYNLFLKGKTIETTKEIKKANFMDFCLF